jgi:NADPH oxidase
MAKLAWYKRELTGRRLVYNVLFYGGHAGMFAYGWWKQVGEEIHKADTQAEVT